MDSGIETDVFFVEVDLDCEFALLLELELDERAEEAELALELEARDDEAALALELDAREEEAALELELETCADEAEADIAFAALASCWAMT